MDEFNRLCALHKAQTEFERLLDLPAEEQTALFWKRWNERWTLLHRSVAKVAADETVMDVEVGTQEEPEPALVDVEDVDSFGRNQGNSAAPQVFAETPEMSVSAFGITGVDVPQEVEISKARYVGASEDPQISAMRIEAAENCESDLVRAFESGDGDDDDVWFDSPEKFESELYPDCDDEDDTKTGDNDVDVAHFPPRSPIAVVDTVSQPQTQATFKATAAMPACNESPIDSSSSDFPDDNRVDLPEEPLEADGITAMLDRFTRQWDPGGVLADLLRAQPIISNFSDISVSDNDVQKSCGGEDAQSILSPILLEKNETEIELENSAELTTTLVQQSPDDSPGDSELADTSGDDDDDVWFDSPDKFASNFSPYGDGDGDDDAKIGDDDGDVVTFSLVSPTAVADSACQPQTLEIDEFGDQKQSHSSAVQLFEERSKKTSSPFLGNSLEFNGVASIQTFVEAHLRTTSSADADNAPFEWISSAGKTLVGELSIIPWDPGGRKMFADMSMRTVKAQDRGYSLFVDKRIKKSRQSWVVMATRFKGGTRVFESSFCLRMTEIYTVAMKKTKTATEGGQASEDDDSAFDDAVKTNTVEGQPLRDEIIESSYTPETDESQEDDDFGGRVLATPSTAHVFDKMIEPGHPPISLATIAQGGVAGLREFTTTPQWSYPGVRIQLTDDASDALGVFPLPFDANPENGNFLLCSPSLGHLDICGLEFSYAHGETGVLNCDVEFSGIGSLRLIGIYSLIELDCKSEGHKPRVVVATTFEGADSLASGSREEPLDEVGTAATFNRLSRPWDPGGRVARMMLDGKTKLQIPAPDTHLIYEGNILEIKSLLNEKQRNVVGSIGTGELIDNVVGKIRTQDEWYSLETVLGQTLKTAKTWVEVATGFRGGGPRAALHLIFLNEFALFKLSEIAVKQNKPLELLAVQSSLSIVVNCLFEDKESYVQIVALGQKNLIKGAANAPIWFLTVNIRLARVGMLIVMRRQHLFLCSRFFMINIPKLEHRRQLNLAAILKDCEVSPSVSTVRLAADGVSVRMAFCIS